MGRNRAITRFMARRYWSKNRPDCAATVAGPKGILWSPLFRRAPCAGSSTSCSTFQGDKRN